MIDIADILTLATANIVAGALLVSLVGATIATAIRHKTNANWHPNLEDAWYYILSGGVSVAIVLMGMDTGTILAATTGINTPLAVLRTGLEKRKANGVTIESVQADIETLKKRGINLSS